MLVDPVRVVAEWLADPAEGVNALLASAPRDPGENPPDPVVVLSELDDDRVARGAAINRELLTELDDNAEPQAYLFVAIHEADQGGQPQPLRAQALTEYDVEDPAIVGVDVIYARRNIERPGSIVTVVSQKRDAQQVVRTAFRVIAAKFASSLTAYTRNDCELTLPKTGILLRVHPILTGDDLVLHGMTVPLRVVDRWALAITS